MCLANQYTSATAPQVAHETISCTLDFTGTEYQLCSQAAAWAS